MPEEQGIVIRTMGDRALVRTHRLGACEGCRQSGACHTFSGAGDVMEIEAINHAGAVQGDTVTIRLSDGVFLSASVAVYVVPVLAFIAGAVGADALAGRLGLDPDLWAFFGGVALCGLAFAMVRLVLNLFPGHKDALIPVIISRGKKILATGDSCHCAPPVKTD